MPYVYSEEDLEWPDDAPDDFEFPPPRVNDFQYLKPPDFGGETDPVQFSIDPRAKPPKGPKPPLFVRIVLWLVKKRDNQVAEAMHRQEQMQLEAYAQSVKTMSIMVPALRAAGVASVRCAYDGGNDEGFAWFDSARTDDGILGLDEVVRRLPVEQLAQELRAASPVNINQTAEHLVRNIVEGAMPEDWAVLLLGRGFGTGPFSMFGAFDVDLAQCLITDDPNATIPDNGNIVVSGNDESTSNPVA